MKASSEGHPDPPPFLTIEITLIVEAHAEFWHIYIGPSSLRIHRIDAVADTAVQTWSSRPEIQEF